MKLYKEKGIVQSVNPPETSFGYSYWSYMIPPFKPDSVLILGYGEETIAALINMVWGHSLLKESLYEADITGIDCKYPKNNYYCENLIIGDAKEEIKNIKNKFDYVVVDIADGDKIPEFVFSEEFVKDLAKVTKNLLSINILNNQGNLGYYHDYFNFDLMKEFLDNKIYFFKNKKINEKEWFL